ncbi:unnamed protein product [Moneuplotes crassus]|uniref:U-box domain-containing protein n=1 Tax=Euplotes crassus TaxID=5936 RepID=A0AAD1UQ86_EUPCR|nr:unnamed protein product [Moneuplotes crassus]
MLDCGIVYLVWSGRRDIIDECDYTMLTRQILTRNQLITQLEEKLKMNKLEIKSYKSQITNLKESEQKLKESVHSLEQSNKSINSAMKSIEENKTSIIKDQEATIEKLKTKVNNQKNALGDLHRCIDHKKLLVCTAEKKNRELDLKLKKMTNKYRQIDTLNTSIQSKDIQIEQLKAALLEEQNKNKKFKVKSEEHLKVCQKQNQLFKLNKALKTIFEEIIPINNSYKKIICFQLLIYKLQFKVFELEKLVSDGQVPIFEDPPIDFGPQIAKIKSHFECPILLEEIESPVICPSGHTVDLKVYEQLVRDGRKDPFSGEKLGDKVVVNRFMVAIKEILNQSNSMVKEETEDH